MMKKDIFLIDKTMTSRTRRYFVMVLFWVIFGITAYTQNNHPDDYTGLRALYLSTGGDNRTVKTEWPSKAVFDASPTIPAGTD